MFINVVLVAAWLVIGLILPWYVGSRREYRRLADAPRLTVRDLSAMPELPEWVVLDARTGGGTVTAPLSGTTCVWYQVTVGRTRVHGDAGSAHVFKALYTGTSQDNGIPLVDPGDPDTVVWLSKDLAGKRLGYTIPAPATTTVDEQIGVANRHGAAGSQEWPVNQRDAAGWRHLRRLQADGHLTAEDIALSASEQGLAVTETTVAPDTPVLVLGTPERQDIGIVLTPARGRRSSLTGTTTWPDSQLRRRYARWVTVYRRVMLGAVLALVLACGWVVGSIVLAER